MTAAKALPRLAMRSRSKAVRAAIGLFVLAVHVAVIVALCIPHRSRDQVTAPEGTVSVYVVVSAAEPVRSGGHGQASARSPIHMAIGAERHSHPRAPALTRRSARPDRSHEAAAHPPAPTAHPAVPTDWAVQGEQAAKQEVGREEAARQRASGLTHRSGVSAAITSALRPPPPPPPEFGWAQYRIHRIEVIKGLGIVIHLSERCSLLIAGLMLLPGCTLNKIEARGDLFAHMHDPTDPDPKALP